MLYVKNLKIIFLALLLAVAMPVLCTADGKRHNHVKHDTRVSPSDVRSDPSSPLVAADSPPATVGRECPAPVIELLGRWHGGPVYSSAVSGDHVYFGTGGFIRVLKIKQTSGQPTSWEEVASIVTSGIVRGLDASGSHLYVADESRFLRIIDMSNYQILFGP